MSRKQQKGGASSDYASLWHAQGADPAQLSRYTLSHIDKAPMFNPLQSNTVIPTGTSGIIPTGAYYDAVAPMIVSNNNGPTTAQNQTGGMKLCTIM
jgi:hypothetical protein